MNSISGIRRICEGEHLGSDLRNEDLCRKIAIIDEAFIYGLDRDILNLHPERSVIENIDEVLSRNETIKNKGYRFSNISTYPFGTKTDDVFSRFLAICRGNEKLEAVLRITLAQAKKMAEKFNKDEAKTIILVSDKWDLETFRKYEKQILKYAVNEGIWFIFLLATDYGYTEIPFLPHDRNALQDLAPLEFVSIKEMLKMVRMDPIIYEISEGTWGHNRNTQTFYTIYDKVWHKESFGNPPIKGKVSSKALERFLDKMAWFLDEEEKHIIPENRALDSGRCMLSLFNKQIVWDFSSDLEGKFLDSQQAISEFIKNCENNVIEKRE